MNFKLVNQAILHVSLTVFLPISSNAADIWDTTGGITLSSDTAVTSTTATSQSENIAISSGTTLRLNNGTLNQATGLGTAPLHLDNSGTISVQGASGLEDRLNGRAVIRGGSVVFGDNASLVSNSMSIREGTTVTLGSRAGSLTTSSLGIDSSRINIPLVATQASDAPINLGYTGNGYTASGSGVLSFNPHQTGTVDLGTITINGLVTDVTKAKIGVGQTQNIYLATGVTSIDQGSAATPVSDLSAVQLTTNDVLFSMSGLTYSGNSLLASVSRRAAQAAMPMLPKELAGIVDGYTPGTNTFMDSAVTKGSSAAQAVTSASYASSVGAGGVAAVSTNTQNVGAIAARASGQAMTPGSVTASLSRDSGGQSGMSAGDSLDTPLWKQGLGIWASPVYMHDRGFGISVGSFDTGYNADTYGLVFGADYTFGNYRVGVAGNLGAGYVQSTGDLAKTKNHLNYGGMSLYGSWNLDPFTLTASGGWMRTHNSLDQENVAGNLTADYDADLWSANLLAEYTLHAASVNIVPGVGVSYGFYDQHKFDTEMQGSAIANNGRAQLNIVNIPVGIRANTDFSVGNGVLTPELRARWISSVADTHLKYDVRMPGSTGVASANSPMLDNQTGEVGAGLKYSIGDFSITANYDYQFSEHHASHGVNALLRLEF